VFEMARDLAGDVEKLMKASNSYVKKKAVLCACRIVRKVPEMMENFIPLIKPLLTDKNHGVQLTSIALITDMCRINSTVQITFKKYVPTLVRILKNLIMAGYSPEHDVNGISDPFLQVRIIRLLRILGHNDETTSETMNDILAQVATNTETTKNVGNAILYETVLTIMDIKSESGLRVLAVNISRRFLVNSDKNIRYVALNSLLKTVQTDMNAVQRHRTTILDCLKDPDPSILKRAMELCFSLINSTNVRGTMRELLTFLTRCPPEFKSDCSFGILLAAEKFSPNTKWHIDTILKVLTTAGNFVRDDAVPGLIHLLSASESMHSYSVQNLYKALITSDDLTIQPIQQVACFCFGEYGNELLNQSLEQDDDNIEITNDSVLQLLEKILSSSLTTSTTKSYAINAVMKLSTRFTEMKSEAERIISEHVHSHNMEVQQRSVEYSILFNKHNNLRPGVLEPMPQFERPPKEEDYGNEEDEGELVANDNVEASANVPAPPAAEQSNVDLLLDLGLDLAATPQMPQPTIPISSNPLADLMGNGLMQQPPPVTNGVGTGAPTIEDLLGGSLFNGGSAAPVQKMNQQKEFPSIVAYNKNNLKIDFSLQRELTTITIQLTVSNHSGADMTNFVFQAAVPKSFQLQLLPPSGNLVSANNMGVVTQTIKLNNPSSAQPRLRIRISYQQNGQTVEDTSEINNFPPSTWQ
jgi:AP-1 complex subunit gamma-1